MLKLTIRLAIALSAAVCLPIPASASEWVNGIVVSVTDGDTAVVETTRQEILRVHFYGIDAPETENRRWPTQPYSEASKAFMADLIDQQPVTVRLTGEQTYNRGVGEIFVDGKSASRELIRVGLAWWNSKYAPLDTDLERLEATARENKIGLWSDANPVPPWEYRKRYR